MSIPGRPNPGRLWRDRAGATTIEYGLLIALVAISAIDALAMLRNGLSDTFVLVAADMSNSSGGDF